MQSINGGALLDNLLGTGTGLLGNLLSIVNTTNPLGSLPLVGAGLTVQVTTGSNGLPTIVIGLGTSTQS